MVMVLIQPLHLEETIGSVQEILVSVDGVVQDTAAYTVPDGSTLTFSAAPSSGTGNIFVYFLELAAGTINTYKQSLRVTLRMVVCSEQMHKLRIQHNNTCHRKCTGNRNTYSK